MRNALGVVFSNDMIVGVVKVSHVGLVFVLEHKIPVEAIFLVGLGV